MLTFFFYIVLTLAILLVLCLIDELISAIPGADEAIDRWIMRNIVRR